MSDTLSGGAIGGLLDFRDNTIAVAGDYQAKPGAEVTIKLDASDPEGKPLKVQWSLYAESGLYFTGGDKMQAPPSFPELITSASNTSCTLTLPEAKGIYRAKFDADSGKLSKIELAAEIRSPGFLAKHPNGRFLYLNTENYHYNMVKN